MKKIITTCILLFTILNIYPLSETEFILSIIDKKNATFEDAVIAFSYLYKLKPGADHTANIAGLKNKIKYFPKKQQAEKLLTFGDFGLLAIQKLNIESGIFYLSTRAGRYAVRELSLINFFPSNTSELKEMSGAELLKYIQKVTEYEEKYKN